MQPLALVDVHTKWPVTQILSTHQRWQPLNKDSGACCSSTSGTVSMAEFAMRQEAKHKQNQEQSLSWIRVIDLPLIIDIPPQIDIF